MRILASPGLRVLVLEKLSERSGERQNRVCCPLAIQNSSYIRAMVDRRVVRISVIIPVFNGAATLPFCLQALADSQYQAAEYLVIDDGSTDESVALAEQFGATVLSTGGRCGPAKA